MNDYGIEFKQVSKTEIHVTAPVGNLLNPNKEPLTRILRIPEQGGQVSMDGHDGPLGFIGDNLKAYKYPVMATKQIFMHQVKVQISRQYRMLEKLAWEKYNGPKTSSSQELEWEDV